MRKMQGKTKKFWVLPALTAVMLGCALVVFGLAGTVPAAEAGINSAEGNLYSMGAGGRTKTRPPVTVVATRTANPTQTTEEAAKTALTTWSSQTVGLTPTFSEARGVTTQVLATYAIPTEQYGLLTANIDASRAAYGGRVDGGGYEVVLLGGGSSVTKTSLSVKLKSASLGYLQLPAATFPDSSEAALAQLLTAFPALSGYDFQAKAAPGPQGHTYRFYATKTDTTTTRPVTTTTTGVSIGVITLGGKNWVYALVGSGSYAVTVPAN